MTGSVAMTRLQTTIHAHEAYMYHLPYVFIVIPLIAHLDYRIARGSGIVHDMINLPHSTFLPVPALVCSDLRYFVIGDFVCSTE